MEACCDGVVGHKLGAEFSLTPKKLNVVKNQISSKLPKLWKEPLGLKHMVFVPTVPSPVKNIQVSVKTDTIYASWSPGSGHVDRYKLVLLNNHVPVHEIYQEDPLTSYTFSGLTAGHLYNLSIITQAAGLENSNFQSVRTGMISKFITTEEANGITK